MVVVTVPPVEYTLKLLSLRCGRKPPRLPTVDLKSPSERGSSLSMLLVDGV